LPLLITGIAGVPGYNALSYFRRRYGDAVTGVRRPNHWPLRGPGIAACDLEDPAAVRRLFAEHRFAAVLNCVGSCRLKSCEFDPAMARRVNVATTRNVVEEASRAGARVIHLSIDLVFPGRNGGWYREYDPPDPVTVYGATMVTAETVVRRTVPGSLILRISLPMGVSFNGHAGAIDWIASRFKQGKPATLYYDEVRTPTYVDCMNQVYEHLLAADLAGTFHAGGPRPLSLYQIAQIVNVVGGYDPALLKGCYRHEAGGMPPRAGDVTLDSSGLADAIGTCPFDPWPLDDHLVPDSRDWHLDRPGQLPGSADEIGRRLYRNRSKAPASPTPQ
jgi:dTDP-4-dehydrorhamnose reductase